MTFTKEQAEALQKRVQEKRSSNKLLDIIDAPKAKGKTEKPQNEKINKTERRYAAHLERLRQAGEILWYRNHAFGVYFEDGTRYTCDFVTMDKEGGISLIDCKAYRKNQKRVHITEASMIRLKRTASEYWMFTIKATWEEGGVWKEMVF